MNRHRALEELIGKAFEPLVIAARDNPQALLRLASEARRKGDLKRSHELAQQALALRPDDPETNFGVRELLSRTVPNWHFPMMRDKFRNQAFLDAIERAVKPGMKVLDIGSGSGLLAMIAARAGAHIVHSCEMNPIIADVAQEIVNRNGFGDKIRIHNKNSKQLDPEADLDGPADLVISEIIGKDLVCERVLPSMRDAVIRLAKPGAQFIPQGGEIRIALAYYADLEKRSVDQVCGFDLSHFNRLRRARMDLTAKDPALELRGEGAALFKFDFTSADNHLNQTQLELVSTGGIANGVVQWFKLQMDAEGSFENPPGPHLSQSWGVGFFPFAKSVELNPGDRLTISGKISNDELQLWQADAR